MAYNHEYPYVDPNRYNSDWALNQTKKLRNEMATFEALNKITFSGEWDITKQYPAWTIVNDNNGRDGYISIQPVPAGVTIDNADYWRAVANYSDVIADLQNRVIALEGDVGALEKDVEILKHHKYIFIGDSFMNGYIDGVTYMTGFAQRAVNKLGLSAADYHIVAVDGSGFSVVGNSFLDALQTLDNVITEKDEITDIYVVGGTNDGSTSVSSEIAAFVAYAKTTYPNAQISIASNGYDSLNNYYARVHYKEAAYNNGIGFLESFAFVLSELDRDSLGAHPNDRGQTRLAECMESEILGITFHPNDYSVPTITADAQWTGAPSFTMKSVTDGAYSELLFAGYWAASGPTSMNALATLDMLTVDGSVIISADPVNVPVLVNANLGSGVTTTTVNMQFQLSNGVVKMRNLNPLNLTSINFISIPGFKFSGIRTA